MKDPSIPLTELWVKIFPSLHINREIIRIIQEGNVILIRSPHDLNNPLKKTYSYFQFDISGIFFNVSQELIFKKLISGDLLQKLYEGLDLIVLAVGCFGTGKIHSMYGKNTRKEFKGIIPRLLEFIFNCKEEDNQTRDFKISLVYIHIIGKQFFNLLKPDKPRCDATVKPTVANSLDDALSYIYNGGNRKGIKNHYESGTTVLTIDVECSFKHLSKLVTNKSKIHLVVLPGNGSIREQNLPTFKQEGNSTKTHLNTLRAWAKDTLDETVPNWRSSKLATYLGSSLSKSYIRCLIHIKVSESDIRSTIATLNFAYNLFKLPSPKVVESLPKSTLSDIYIKELKEEIEKMKETQIMNEVMNGVYKDMTKLLSKEEKRNAKKLVKSFLNDTALDSSIEDNHPILFLNIFKDLFQREISEIKGKLIKMSDEIADIQRIKKKKGGIEQNSFTSNSSLMLKIKKRKRTKAEEGKESEKISETSLRHLSDTFCFEEQMAAERNYKNIFQEFLNRHPLMRLRLKALSEDIVEYTRVRNSNISDMEKIKMELENITIGEKLLEENIKVNSSTQKPRVVVPTLEEQQKILRQRREMLEEKCNACRRGAAQAHNGYIEKSLQLHEFINDMEKKFNDYALKTYTTTLLLPPLDYLLKAPDNQ